MAKLTIQIESNNGVLVFDRADVIVAQFNPNKLVLSKAANWTAQPPAQRDVPELQFTTSDPRTLSIDLVFDTYDAPGTGKVDVRTYTDRLLDLTTVKTHGKLHRPPVCRLMWDRANLMFQGVVQQLDTTFTMFMDDGTPVRAAVKCTFKEWRTNGEDLRAQRTESADVAKAHVVRHGDTLASIAAAEYRDSRAWRPIARANGLDDPMAIVPGTTLRIPTLTGRSAGKDRP